MLKVSGGLGGGAAFTVRARILTGGAAGLADAFNWSSRVGLISTFLLSTPLRKTNWMVPWVLVSSSLCESSGLNSSVTTLTVWGLPWGSGSIVWPAARTSTFCKTVCVMGPTPPGGL